MILPRRDFIRTAALGGIAAGTLGFPHIARAATIKVGAALPFSGGLELFGQQARLGLDLAVAEINAAGGILGEQIEIIYEDNKTDPKTSNERARKLMGRSGLYVPTRSAVEDAHLQRGDVERLRSEVTVSALKAAAVHLGGMRDGRKAIILISEGLRGIMRDSSTLLTDLVRTANDNNTAIYAIDPRGFGPQRFQSLFEGVAEDTGGQFFRSNDLVAALGRVVQEASGFYLLGYSPLERPLDGRFHKIRVKVKPSGL